MNYSAPHETDGSQKANSENSACSSHHHQHRAHTPLLTYQHPFTAAPLPTAHAPLAAAALLPPLLPLWRRLDAVVQQRRQNGPHVPRVGGRHAAAPAPAAARPPRLGAGLGADGDALEDGGVEAQLALLDGVDVCFIWGWGWGWGSVGGGGGWVGGMKVAWRKTVGGMEKNSSEAIRNRARALTGIDGVVAHEAVDRDLARLAQAVAAVLGLAVDLGCVCVRGGQRFVTCVWVVGLAVSSGACAKPRKQSGGAAAEAITCTPTDPHTDTQTRAPPPTCGLKSTSWRMTVSAPVRLSPWPPARVDSRNANAGLSAALKASQMLRRSETWRFGWLVGRLVG